MNPPRIVVAAGRLPAHELLRSEVAHFHAVSVDEIALTHRCERCASDTHGRPLVIATAAIPQPAQVSVSRAGDLSVVAVTDRGPVGVDVEPADANTAELGPVILHPHESATDLTLVWVRKEAVLKAYGLGLAVDPSHIALDHGIVTAWDSPHASPGPLWWRDIDLPGYAAAVAVVSAAGPEVVEVVEVRVYATTYETTQ